MTKNERRLLNALIGILICAISAINILATRDARTLYAENQDKNALAMRSASTLYAELASLQKELQELEKRETRQAASAEAGKRTDILTVGYQSRKVIDECGIEVVRYAMDKTASSELVTYTIRSSPEEFTSFLNKMDKGSLGLSIPSCEVRTKDQTNEVEGQFCVGYEK